MIGYLYALAGVIIAGFAQIFLKKGAMRPHISFIRDYLNPHVIIGYFMMALTVFCPMLAFNTGLNYLNVTIIEAVGFIFVPVLSRLIFKEKFTKVKMLGFAVIIAGIAVYYL